MLESATLWLGPWTDLDGSMRSGSRQRAIRDRSAGRELGLVRWQRPRRYRWLLGWDPERITVAEGPDESLLLILEPGWIRSDRWRVLDAERSLVGMVAGLSLLDQFGRVFASRVSDSAAGAPGRFLGSRRNELGRLTIDDEGLCLSFEETLEGCPFPRMILLAATILIPWPQPVPRVRR